jgi:hypothetical protein
MLAPGGEFWRLVSLVATLLGIATPTPALTDAEGWTVTEQREIALPGQSIDLASQSGACSVNGGYEGYWVIVAPPKSGTTSTRVVMGPKDRCPYLQRRAVLSYTMYEGATDAQDTFDARWWPYPNADAFMAIRYRFYVQRARVEVTQFDWVNAFAMVNLVGPSGSEGPVDMQFRSTSGSVISFPLGSYMAGLLWQPINRLSLPRGSYKEVTATWKLGDSLLSGKILAGTEWRVLGKVRYTQYNVPTESQCSGKVKASEAFLKVTTITGSCNTELVAGRSLATLDANGHVCGTDFVLINSNNTNHSIRRKEDRCPGCTTPGVDEHIDSFTSQEGCTSRAVGDLGLFWTTLK